MDVTLSAELEDLVREKVATGLYRDETEVVAEALRLLDRLDQPPEWTNDSLREAVQKGFDAIAAGDLKRINTREELIAFFDGL